MKAVSYKLTDLLDEVRSGAYLIPRFQRKFVWKEDQSCKLIDSLARNYPIGALLTLPKETLQLAHTPIEAAIDFPEKAPDSQVYLLDGQQRLTSISRAMLGADPDHLYYFNLDAMYDELVAESTADSEWVVAFKRPARRPRRPEPHELPCECVTSMADSNARVHTYLREQKNVPDHQIFQVAAKLMAVFEIIRNYQVISHQLEKKESLDAICRIFETINNTGVKLDTFDLVVAKYYSPEFDLRDMVDNQLAANPDAKLLGLDYELYLHAINYYVQFKEGRRPDLSKAGLLQIPKEKWRAHLPDAVRAFSEIYRWLSGFSLSFLSGRPLVPNMMLTIIAAAEMAYPGSLRHPLLQQRLAKWVLGTLWNSPVYNKTVCLGDCSSIQDFFARFNSGGELKHAPLTRITVEQLLDISPHAKMYLIVHAIIRQGLSKDILGAAVSNIGELEDHHILPKSIADQRGLNKRLYNCIGNRVLVTKETNRRIAQDSLPTVYFGLAKHHLDEVALSRNLTDNHIDPSRLYLADMASNDAEFIDWMRPRLESIADALNRYFGL